MGAVAALTTAVVVRPTVGAVATLSAAQNQSTTNIMRSELMVCRKQVSDLRAMNLFLKKEKLKAEHERNLFDIRNKQLEALL